MYNGHKHIHAIKFQSLVLPNGLVANLYGPLGNYVFQGAVFTNYQYTYHVIRKDKLESKYSYKHGFRMAAFPYIF